MSQRYTELFNELIENQDKKRLRRVRKLIDGPTSVETVVDGKPTLAFCSNDYLGMSQKKNVIEIGPGKVLSGLVKRINKNVKITSINSQSDIESLRL